MDIPERTPVNIAGPIGPDDEVDDHEDDDDDYVDEEAPLTMQIVHRKGSRPFRSVDCH